MAPARLVTGCLREPSLLPPRPLDDLCAPGGQLPAAGQERGHRPARDRGGELGVFPGRLDEDAAQARTAARHQAHVVAEQQGGLGQRRADVCLHLLSPHPPVGDDLVEVVHHLGLGHDGQPGQVSQLEPSGIDPGEPGRVERRGVDGPGQQRPQPRSLEFRECPVSVEVARGSLTLAGNFE
jgi:hypothetical protein